MSRFIAKKLVWLVPLAAAGVIYLYLRPLPPIQPVGAQTTHTVTKAIGLPWPTGVQSALGAEGYGLMTTHGSQTPVPIASVSKIITALAVLRQKPLATGQSGPLLTLDTTDLGYFNYYYLRGGSVAQVAVGEKISEYQALQAMLLPSANNIADSLARWAFGSTDTYLAYANRMVLAMGLSQTTVGSTNGFADKTFSIAADVVRLGLAAMQNPVIAGIVGQSTATIPVEGTIHNVNYLIGQDNIVGIKTGNTDAAGGCFLFAAEEKVMNRRITLVGAVLGAKNLTAALAAAPPLIKASAGNFQQITIVKSSQTIGYYHSPWGQTVRLQPAHDLFLTVWRGQDIKVDIRMEPARAPQPALTNIGSVEVISGGQTASAPLELTSNLTAPSWRYRIFRR